MKLVICTQQRHAPNPHSCGNEGGIAIANKLEEIARRNGLNISIKRTPCINKCDNGPFIQLQIEGKHWYRVTIKEIDELFRKLHSGNQFQDTK